MPPPQLAPGRSRFGAFPVLGAGYLASAARSLLSCSDFHAGAAPPIFNGSDESSSGEATKPRLRNGGASSALALREPGPPGLPSLRRRFRRGPCAVLLSAPLAGPRPYTVQQSQYTIVNHWRPQHILVDARE